MEARQVLIKLANEFQNDFLSVACFGEHHGLTEDQARQLIQLAQEVRSAPHPDA